MKYNHLLKLWRMFTIFMVVYVIFHIGMLYFLICHYNFGEENRKVYPYMCQLVIVFYFHHKFIYCDLELSHTQNGVEFYHHHHCPKI